MSNKGDKHQILKLIFAWLVVFLVIWEDEPIIKVFLCHIQSQLFGVDICRSYVNAFVVSTILTGIGYMVEKSHEIVIRREAIEQFRMLEEQLGGWWLYGLVDFRSPLDYPEGQINVVGFFHMKHSPGEKDVYDGHAFEYAYKENNVTEPLKSKRGIWRSLSVFGRKDDKFLGIYYEMRLKKNILDAEEVYLGVISIEPNKNAHHILRKPSEWRNIYCGTVSPITRKHKHNGYIFCVKIDTSTILSNISEESEVVNAITKLLKRDAHQLIKETKSFSVGGL